jgi:hypothetical protein
MLLSLVGLLGAVAGVNWAVNPYGAWRTTLVDPVYRHTWIDDDEVGERVTTAYRIRVEQPTTLLVGSSRVLNGMPVEPGDQDGGFFNASLSGASLAEIAAILRLATANPRLRRVVWGVEFYAFQERFVGFRHPETRMRLEGDEWRLMVQRVAETLLSHRALRDSQAVLKRVLSGRERQRLAPPVPWPDEVIRQRLEDAPGQPGLDRDDEASLRSQLQNWIVNYLGYRQSGEQLSLFRRTVASARAAGIEVILFVPPLSRCELEAIDQAGTWSTFQRWKRQLLETGPYWDFSGYGKLDRAESFFLDVPHFKPAVGHAILRRVLGRDCAQCGERARIVRDAGDRVDTATVDSDLTRQEAMRTASRQRNERCSRAVEEVLRAHATPAASP